LKVLVVGDEMSLVMVLRKKVEGGKVEGGTMVVDEETVRSVAQG
jgi:hypothetical protein